MIVTSNVKNENEEIKKCLDYLAEEYKKSGYSEDDYEHRAIIRWNDGTKITNEWVIHIDDLLQAMNEGRITCRAEDLCDCELEKEYVSDNGFIVKRYVTKKTPEEQEMFEKLATRRIWEIISKYADC